MLSYTLNSEPKENTVDNWANFTVSGYPRHLVMKELRDMMNKEPNVAWSTDAPTFQRVKRCLQDSKFQSQCPGLNMTRKCSMKVSVAGRRCPYVAKRSSRDPQKLLDRVRRSTLFGTLSKLKEAKWSRMADDNTEHSEEFPALNNAQGVFCSGWAWRPNQSFLEANNIGNISNANQQCLAEVCSPQACPLGTMLTSLKSSLVYVADQPDCQQWFVETDALVRIRFAYYRQFYQQENSRDCNPWFILPRKPQPPDSKPPPWECKTTAQTKEGERYCKEYRRCDSTKFGGQPAHRRRFVCKDNESREGRKIIAFPWPAAPKVCPTRVGRWGNGYQSLTATTRFNCNYNQDHDKKHGTHCGPKPCSTKKKCSRNWNTKKDTCTSQCDKLKIENEEVEVRVKTNCNEDEIKQAPKFVPQGKYSTICSKTTIAQIEAHKPDYYDIYSTMSSSCLWNADTPTNPDICGHGKLRKANEEKDPDCAPPMYADPPTYMRSNVLRGMSARWKDVNISRRRRHRGYVTGTYCQSCKESAFKSSNHAAHHRRRSKKKWYDKSDNTDYCSACLCSGPPCFKGDGTITGGIDPKTDCCGPLGDQACSTQGSVATCH